MKNVHEIYKKRDCYTRRIISDGALGLLLKFLVKNLKWWQIKPFYFKSNQIFDRDSFFVFLSVSQTQYRKDREELVDSLFSAMPETLQTNFAREMAETHSEVAHRSCCSHSRCSSRFALT